MNYFVSPTTTMKYLSLEPFIPSGPDYAKAKELFADLGFMQTWDAGDYTGFENNGCRFILQKLDKRDFADNLMMSVGIENAEDFLAMLRKEISEKYQIRFTEIIQQPYGKEVNLIDLAGVCWHFVQS
jgi:hypothetical protein